MRRRGNSFYSGSTGPDHVIRVGHEMWLDDWSKVNCDNNRVCVPGIHTGNLDYIEGWSTDNNVTLSVLVDPRYIGAVSASEHVLRCLRIMPIAIYNRESHNKEFYSSYRYAAQNDEVWLDETENIIRKFNSEKKNLENRLLEIRQEKKKFKKAIKNS